MANDELSVKPNSQRPPETLVFYATIIIVMVFGGGAIVNKLLGG